MTDRTSARVAAIVATADITAALRELRYISDPKFSGTVANVRQRLEGARAEIERAALFIDGAIEPPVVVRKIVPSRAASQTRDVLV